ncbi:hypothetical protein L208DRAFT_1395644 [Tricholoma matsutake]|nr:hypothetical protein L208DRAFT_1395644 [Tricholoma matsutake 945]
MDGPAPTSTAASNCLQGGPRVLRMTTTRELGWETLPVSGEPLRWQQSCGGHRTTMIGTRIWGCVGHGAVGMTVMSQQDDTRTNRCA